MKFDVTKFTKQGNQKTPQTSSIENNIIGWKIGNGGINLEDSIGKNMPEKELKEMCKIVDKDRVEKSAKKELKQICNVEMCKIVDKYREPKPPEDAERDEHGKVTMCEIIEVSDFNKRQTTSMNCNQQKSEAVTTIDQSARGIKDSSTMLKKASYSNVNTFQITTGIQNQEIEALTNQKAKNEYLQNSEIKFMENSKGLFYGGKFFMNCIIRISKKVVETTPEEQTAECFQINIYFANGDITQKRKSVKEFREGVWLKECSDVIFYCDGDSSIENKILKKYMNYIMIIRQCDTKVMYDHQGWQEDKKSHKLVYVTKNGVLGCPDTKMAAYKGKDFCLRSKSQNISFTIGKFIEISNIVEDGVGVMILLYTIQSYMYTFFKKAGIIPKMTMFLAGTKGSHKTSVALCMAEPNNCITPKYTFKGTTAGLETGFPECTDAVQVIDDLMPVQDLGERRRIESNLEMITRCYGDGTQRIRNNDYVNANGNHKNISQYKANGGCLFTGEYYSGCGSTLARTILLNMDKKIVNLDLLTYYQNHSEIKGDFLFYFIEYLTKRQEDIINAMKYRLQQLRNNQRGRYSNPRYGEYYSTLRVAAEILLRFGVDVGAYTQFEGKQLLNQYDHIILKTLAENDRKLKDEEPHIRICKAIWEAYIDPAIDKVNSCKFIPNGAIAIDEGNAGYVYIRMKDIIYYIKKYRESYNQFVEATESQVIRSLKEYGILIPKKEGNGVRNTMKISGNKSAIKGQRFAYLNLNKVKEYIGE